MTGPLARAGRLRLAVVGLLLVTWGVGGSPGPAAALPPEEGPVTVVSTRPGQLLEALGGYARLMTLPSMDTGARALSSAPLFTGEDPCPRPRCADRAVPVPPGVDVTSNLVRVLLPSGYRHPDNRHRRYPVVYLLNGARSDHDAWTYKTELLRASSGWKAIFVMPAGGKLEEAGFFTDWADGTWDWETYHTQVLVPWVDERYRTLPGARAVGGASMGALGAVNYAARHPGMFAAVLSISGLLDTTGLLTQGLLGPSAEQPDLRRVWGDPVLDSATWNAHNPTRQAAALRDVALFLTSGTGYVSRPGTTEVYTGDFEKTMWDLHRSFLYGLTSRDVPYRARVAVGGVHDWTYFDPALEWAMPKIIRVLRNLPPVQPAG